MVGVAPFADVVKEERQRQQLGGMELDQETGESSPAGHGQVDERFEIAQRQQRVLVDGVLVIKVANHARVNPLELRKDPAEQSAVVHLGETRVQPAPNAEEISNQPPLALGG